MTTYERLQKYLGRDAGDEGLRASMRRGEWGDYLPVYHIDTTAGKVTTLSEIIDAHEETPPAIVIVNLSTKWRGTVLLPNDPGSAWQCGAYRAELHAAGYDSDSYLGAV